MPDTLTCIVLPVVFPAKKNIITSRVGIPATNDAEFERDTEIFSPDTVAADLRTRYSLPVHSTPVLRGQDFGLWEGCSLKGLSPDELFFLTQDPSFVPPQGESQQHFFERISAWLHDLPIDQDDAVVMAGPTVMRMLMLCVLGCDAGKAACLDLEAGVRFRLSRRGHWRMRLG
ncbi:histidine phosphatase family protein [Acetobacter sp.]|uniref:histidine phosphatase family protein n=1 Tax=Acetobacter sp. TaxID=440 RepID=UPI0039EB6CBE